MRLAVLYRPPPTREIGLEQEWPKFLAKYATIDKHNIIVGDLNIHIDIPTDRDSTRFSSTLESSGMRQLVNEPTHVGGHTLEVVITKDTDTIVNGVAMTDPGLSDNTGKVSRNHFAVLFTAKAKQPAQMRKTITFRKLRAINIDLFNGDIKSSDTIAINKQSSDIETLVKAYTDELSSLIDKHALSGD